MHCKEMEVLQGSSTYFPNYIFGGYWCFKPWSMFKHKSLTQLPSFGMVSSLWPRDLVGVFVEKNLINPRPRTSCQHFWALYITFNRPEDDRQQLRAQLIFPGHRPSNRWQLTSVRPLLPPLPQKQHESTTTTNNRFFREPSHANKSCYDSFPECWNIYVYIYIYAVPFNRLATVGFNLMG